MLRLGKVQSGCDDVDSLKGKAILIQAWTLLEGSTTLRLPELLDYRQLKVTSWSGLRTGRLYKEILISLTG